ncbi:hypothetical protein jhhlp_004402 [Lomentospora prolificans]|uniref:Uncharacterized protein n=1 Tax=Lomentospora prolificans TaxID=41688 RepID=A0A2N3NBJ2_9PEZI|nr:hypothetical protein jhhlp_004402 [Lomentospora prolificans]
MTTRRYDTDFLLHLRDSPLCIKPTALPPAEDWMGPPPETFRPQNKTTSERAKPQEGAIGSFDLNPRRNIDRLLSRSTTSPEDTAIGSFGAPRAGFPNAGLRGTKSAFDPDKNNKDGESRGGRFDFRNRNDNDATGDRFRDGRNNNYRRRGEGDQDNEGWSTVKPRKSFGHEGAERFNGRMGGGDRYRDDRRARDRDDADKPNVNRRTYDSAPRDRDAGEDNNEGRPRNGATRGKSDSWFKNEPPNDGLTARERIDRAKSWRDRDRDNDALEDRPSGRTYDRRWVRDRDQKAERDPEWMDAPADDKADGHTEEDFKKFLESMKAREGGASSKPTNQAVEPPAEPQKKAESAPAVEPGPDKFFMAFASPPSVETSTPGAAPETNDAAAGARSKLPGKSSRFTSFFNAAQEEKKPREVAPQQAPMSANGGVQLEPNLPAPDEEKVAFQQLLMKLQKQSLQVSPAPAGPSSFPEPSQAPPAVSSVGPEFPVRAAANATSPEPANVPYGANEPPTDDPRKRMPWAMQDIIAPQPMLPHQTAAARQDQLLQNLVGHRGDSGQRNDSNAARNNSNTEFLMNLMRSQPEAPRTEQMMLRMPQPQKSAPIPHVTERESEFVQNNRFPHQHGPQGPQPQLQHQQMSQQQQPHPQHPQQQHQQQHQQQQRQMRHQPPGFIDEPPFHHGEPEPRGPQPQPTQILQRPPPPPGLDQMGPGGPNWMPQGVGVGGPQQRPMMPPPGLPGGLSRNIPLPPAMYPPNFPPGGPGFPGPEAMGGMPPRNMQPPPGIYGAPPGFFPPPGVGGFQGGPPGDVHGFGGPGGPAGHFDARGMPPPPGVPRGAFPRP